MGSDITITPATVHRFAPAVPEGAPGLGGYRRWVARAQVLDLFLLGAARTVITCSSSPGTLADGRRANAVDTIRDFA